MTTTLTALKAKARENRAHCLLKARYHRNEVRKYRNDPNTRDYHKAQADFWMDNAKWWKTNLPKRLL
jgi:hypothetical protein